MRPTGWWPGSNCAGPTTTTSPSSPTARPDHRDAAIAARDATKDPVLEELDLLVGDLVDGDEAAFARTYELTVGLVASIAHGMLRDRDAADDVTQETYLRLARASTGIRDLNGRALRAWLVRTVRNAAIDHARRASTRRELATDRLPDAPAADDPTVHVEGDQDLARALAGLQAEQREALVLFHVGGLSGAEVAEVIGKSRPATYAVIRRAERAMRSALTDAQSAETARPLSTRRRNPPAHGT